MPVTAIGVPPSPAELECTRPPPLPPRLWPGFGQKPSPRSPSRHVERMGMQPADTGPESDGSKFLKLSALLPRNTCCDDDDECESERARPEDGLGDFSPDAARNGLAGPPSGGNTHPTGKPTEPAGDAGSDQQPLAGDDGRNPRCRGGTGADLVPDDGRLGRTGMVGLFDRAILAGLAGFGHLGACRDDVNAGQPSVAIRCGKRNDCERPVPVSIFGDSGSVDPGFLQNSLQGHQAATADCTGGVSTSESANLQAGFEGMIRVKCCDTQKTGPGILAIATPGSARALTVCDRLQTKSATGLARATPSWCAALPETPSIPLEGCLTSTGVAPGRTAARRPAVASNQLPR